MIGALYVIKHKSTLMDKWRNYRIDSKYLKQYQWMTLPSTLAVIFVALTKGNEAPGFWVTLLIGWLVYSFLWLGSYQITIEDIHQLNKKPYYYLSLITQLIFVVSCICYVLIT